jgi:hypothetical protein
MCPYHGYGDDSSVYEFLMRIWYLEKTHTYDPFYGSTLGNVCTVRLASVTYNVIQEGLAVHLDYEKPPVVEGMLQQPLLMGFTERRPAHTLAAIYYFAQNYLGSSFAVLTKRHTTTRTLAGKPPAA